MDASVLFVGDRYIETMGVPLISGRRLTEQDGQDTPKAVLINQKLAQRYFNDQDPIGQRISMGLPQNPWTPWMTIAGVIADVRHDPRAKLRFTRPSISLKQDRRWRSWRAQLAIP